jgi:hypothetical protein
MTKKSISVILDSNAWRSNLLLRTALGSALLFTLRTTKYKLGLPEVIEEEIIKQTEKAAKEAKDRIERSFRDITAILGSHRPYELPSEEEVRNAIQKRFTELSDIIIRVPFTLSHAKAALGRVNSSVPPSLTKKQQFKDSAIWEAAVELGSEYDILMVSEDGDFYEDKERKVLHSVLKQEIQESGRVIKVYASLDKCLEELQKERPDINRSDVADKIFRLINDQVTESVSTNNLRPTKIKHYEIKPFITEDHNRLAIEYSITLDALNTDTSQVNQREESFVTVEGSCVLNIKDGVIEGNRFHTIISRWVDFEGKEQIKKHYYAHADGGFIGRQPDVVYKTRIELNQV